MPFMMLRPMMWVLFTLPNRSASIAVLIEIRPRRRMISGLVGDLLRAQQQAVAVVGEIGVDRGQRVAADGERRAAGELDLAAVDQVDDRVLDHLGVHLERRDVRVVAQRAENSVGDVATPDCRGRRPWHIMPALELGGEKTRRRSPPMRRVTALTGSNVPVSSAGSSRQCRRSFWDRP